MDCCSTGSTTGCCALVDVDVDVDGGVAVVVVVGGIIGGTLELVPVVLVVVSVVDDCDCDWEENGSRCLFSSS